MPAERGVAAEVEVGVGVVVAVGVAVAVDVEADADAGVVEVIAEEGAARWLFWEEREVMEERR